ncbi:ribonuclease E activity regulator RraA [Alkalihalophilus pseudofirmus]|uniref:4-hydroxy-4-methyl-2-oxoglutarate aldolase n=1 Tax=Alkalihalophilus pseudofirmus TaxID=79885 RepID=A0AAJ2NPA0_ALKPS|nr:ribonuclease E activity regulator RraA [Alkalihalophilus pseudofirmus]MDV2886075.1 ribonuclease E activity regulator RraA [Alkalihalophilus pseudofirmus]WEG16368.1 ribonuclease E activity regulator RraA [Alkalihalophilus pseudofirmus]
MEIITADLCDEFREKVKIADPIFKMFGKRKSFYGPIHTVKVYEDNVLVKKALQTIPEGSVLVVDGGGSTRCALLGDHLADIAVTRKLPGIIVYGCIRDSAEINQMDIGVRAIATHPLKSIKQGKGLEQVAVQFAGINFEPGAYVYVDEDGILVSEQPLV